MPAGASAALLFGAPDLPFSQPRNVIGGHIVCALAGVGAAKLAAVTGAGVALAAPLAVSLGVVAMLGTRCMHPPGGGTCLIAAMAPHDLGWSFVLLPCASVSTMLVVSAVLANNALRPQRYPKYWW
jgi:CBS-domain-containing membrane protein